MVATQGHEAVDGARRGHLGFLVAGAAAVLVGRSGILLTPLLVNAGAVQFGLGAEAVGTFAFFEVLVGVLAGIVAGLWIRHLDLRLAAVAAALWVAGWYGLTVFAWDLWSMVAMISAGAIGGGVVSAVGFTLLARTRDTDAAFGITNAVCAAFAVVCFLVLPPFVAEYRLMGVYPVLAATCAIAAMVILMSLPGPVQAVEAAAASSAPAQAPPAGLLGFTLAAAALTGFSSGIGAVFVEPAARALGISIEQMALPFAVSAIMGFLGALLAPWFSGVMGRLGAALVGLAAHTVGFVAIILTTDVSGFWVALGLAFGWAAFQVYAAAAAAEADPSRTTIALLPAALGLGFAFGPLVGGQIAVRASMDATMIAGIVTGLLAFALMLPAFAQARRMAAGRAVA
jgi:hypothetical protein